MLSPGRKKIKRKGGISIRYLKDDLSDGWMEGCARIIIAGPFVVRVFLLPCILISSLCCDLSVYQPVSLPLDTGAHPSYPYSHFLICSMCCFYITFFPIPSFPSILLFFSSCSLLKRPPSNSPNYSTPFFCALLASVFLFSRLDVCHVTERTSHGNF